MVNIFLQVAPTAVDLGGLAALGSILAFMGIIFVALYVYMSFAYMAIGKKTKQQTPGLAWIPYVGPGLISQRASKMHWWPLLLIIGLIIPVLNGIAGLVYFVFFIIWNWKMMEALGRPGWWALLLLIFPVYLILLGVAAWSK
jgi:hypothetical protein